MAHKYYLDRAAPEESIAHGACRPGYAPGTATDDPVGPWVESMREAGIERVCCLLHAPQLARYLDLIGEYEQAFGPDRVHHAPIKDYHLADPETIDGIVSFLREADRAGEPTVVHCAAGLGRTGQVLAAWLVRGRGYEPDEAIETVESMGRSPREAIRCDNATERDLRNLLAGRTEIASDD
ncbi:MAG: dual specificity protein phosphatase family protein [Haloarculaceae archaeon]